MGKYDGVISTLSRLASEDMGYQQKVDEVKRVMAEDELFTRHASHMAALYVEQRRRKAKIEEELSKCNLELTAIEQMLVEQYEVEGTTSLKLEDGASVAVQLEPYAQVQDRDAFRRWCIAEGYADLMQLPWGTTNSLTKERLLNGEPEPPGVKAFAKSKIVLRGGK